MSIAASFTFGTVPEKEIRAQGTGHRAQGGTGVRSQGSDCVLLALSLKIWQLAP